MSYCSKVASGRTLNLYLCYNLKSFWLEWRMPVKVDHWLEGMQCLQAVNLQTVLCLARVNIRGSKHHNLCKIIMQSTWNKSTIDVWISIALAYRLELCLRVHWLLTWENKWCCPATSSQQARSGGSELKGHHHKPYLLGQSGVKCKVWTYLEWDEWWGWAGGGQAAAYQQHHSACLVHFVVVVIWLLPYLAMAHMLLHSVRLGFPFWVPSCYIDLSKIKHNVWNILWKMYLKE